MNWPAGWLRRKSITVSRASGAISGYQMKILVGQSAGSSGYAVHAEGLCLLSFSDIRFTSGDGITQLPYYIESVTGATPNQTAVVWVKFDSIGTADTTFYMYYDNASASAASSGSTFAALDDVEHGSNGDTLTTPWSTASGTATISTAHSYSGTRSIKLLGAATNVNIAYAVPASDNTAVSVWLYSESTYIGLLNYGNGSKRIALFCDSLNRLCYVDSSNNNVATSYTISPSTWIRIEARHISWTAGTYDLYANDTLVLASVAMFTSNAFTNAITFYGDYSNGYNNWIDNLMVRSSVSPEPAFGSWGTAEPYPDYVPSIVLSPALVAPSIATQSIVSGISVSPSLLSPSNHCEVAVQATVIEPQLLKPTGYRPLSVDTISNAGWVLTENNKRFIRGV